MGSTKGLSIFKVAAKWWITLEIYISDLHKLHSGEARRYRVAEKITGTVIYEKCA